MNALLLRLKTCNRNAIRKSGEIDVPRLARHIERGLAHAPEREINLLALAEYVGGALEGVPPDLDSIPSRPRRRP
jgi:hypothetical protein